MNKISRRNFSKTLTAGLGAAAINPIKGFAVKETKIHQLRKNLTSFIYAPTSTAINIRAMQGIIW